MAQALYNETIENDDGTPASASQLAKDVCTFLKWTAEPELDERKQRFIKVGFGENLSEIHKTLKVLVSPASLSLMLSDA